MAKVKQSETQNKLRADVNPTFAAFAANLNGRNPDREDYSMQNELHSTFPTAKKRIL